MSDQRPAVGTIGWIDLTVEDAEEVRDFYRQVVGWQSEPVDMGGYADFNMKPTEEAPPVAGICHARGGNAGLPAQWLIYVTVEDLDRSLEQVERRGGSVLRRPGEAAGMGRFGVIRDPAGAVAALWEPPPKSGD